jgi:hypothetical protein
VVEADDANVLEELWFTHFVADIGNRQMLRANKAKDHGKNDTSSSHTGIDGVSFGYWVMLETSFNHHPGWPAMAHQFCGKKTECQTGM